MVGGVTSTLSWDFNHSKHTYFSTQNKLTLEGLFMKYIVRNPHGIYKVRIRVNTSLRRYFKRIEINKSLKTSTYKEAVLLTQNIVNEYKKIRVGFSLGFYSKDYIQNIVDDFLNNIIKQSPKVDKVSTEYLKPTSALTHKECIEEFATYYMELDIGNDKRSTTLSFLENVYLPLVGENTPVDSIGFKAMLSLMSSAKVKCTSSAS